MSDLRTPQLSPVGVPSQTSPAAAPSPRLVKAAHEFEASMMKELMAPLVSGAGDPDDEAGGSESALTSFAGEAMANAISEHGGFGIATKILHQLSLASNHSGKSAVPSLKNETTSIGPP